MEHTTSKPTATVNVNKQNGHSAPRPAAAKNKYKKETNDDSSSDNEDTKALPTKKPAPFTKPESSDDSDESDNNAQKQPAQTQKSALPKKANAKSDTSDDDSDSDDEPALKKGVSKPVPAAKLQPADETSSSDSDDEDSKAVKPTVSKPSLQLPQQSAKVLITAQVATATKKDHSLKNPRLNRQAKLINKLRQNIPTLSRLVIPP